MQNGGKRAGAGRPKGRKNKATLEKQIVFDALKQRVLRHVDDLFHAQLTLACGSVQVFREDWEEANGKLKKIHTLVTGAAEIKQVLDEHEGGDGMVGNNYYFVTQVSPDNRAIDSMIDRVFGRPSQAVDVTSNGKDVLTSLTVNVIKKNESRA